ncbi:MAG: filamentous hemagglutinin N-terminal domain-containing protein, partial [Candidatus Omnitrophica bacterium]|nr:filamentous hemagglutinin N-terminal domain-containing protein [Candidatus Omnitrophota bacterium]
SVAINRIFDQAPSQIFGRLSANGQVFLLNPSGIIFGPSAQVDVGGIVASSLNLSHDSVIGAKLSLQSTGAAGAVLNQGQIMARDGGYVALIAPSVINEGRIQATGGRVALAAGDKVSVDFAGDQLVNLNVEQGAIDALVENKGLVRVNEGMVVMNAQAADVLTGSVVNNSGIIEAKGITSKGGRIILDAGENGQTTVSGTLDASSDTAQGGRVVAAGKHVLVTETAQLLATGATGGGEIYAGGGWQGADPLIASAQGVAILKGALLNVSAIDHGNGGTIVAWSDVNDVNALTRAYGTFLANGGVNGGNGGRIETSGHWLDTEGATGSAMAFSGRSGEWLFDPYDVTITGANANGGFAGGIWTPTNSNSTILNTAIKGLLEGGTSVTVTTGAAGGQNGDITVSSAINKNAGNADVVLTLQAANTIVVNAAISNTGGAGKLDVALNADNDNGVHDGVGITLLNADITTNGGSLNFGDGASMSINGASTLVGGDVYVTGAGLRTISTNGGAVNVKGEMIVADTSGLTVNTNGGDVRFYGLLNSGDTYADITSTLTWTAAKAAAATGPGTATGNTYLATITSRLENAVASRTVNYVASWLGARRVTGIGTNNIWRWVAGPEGAQDSGNGQPFFTQNGSDSANGSGGTAIGGAYSNWGSGEPNNFNGADLTSETESALQFTGSSGTWNDLAKAAGTLTHYVKETNLALSPVTVNAGAGSVTFSGAVGATKALKSLTVTAATTNINGGAVTTGALGDGGAQSYSGDIKLGSASTVLTQIDTPTDFTVTASKSITNNTGADATLSIKNTAAIILDTGSSISSATGKLNVVLWADTDANGGYIRMWNGSQIVSNGGHIWMGGGSGSTTWNSLTVGDGYARGNDGNGGNAPSDGINLDGATVNASGSASGGNIYMNGKSADDTSVGIQLGVGNLTTIKTNNAGTITLTGAASTTESGEAYRQGICIWRGVIQSASGAINLTGTGGNAAPDAGLDDSGIFFGGASWQAGTTSKIVSLSGAINLTGTKGSGSGNGSGIRFGSASGLYGQDGTLVANSSSNITLSADTIGWTGIDIAGSNVLHSSGILTVKPLTAAITIGVADGTGTLQVMAARFTDNFTNGFSGIIVGSIAAGNITVGATALSYNDPLTLKTAGNITVSNNAAITGNNNALVLNADTDTNGGGITIGSGVSINTGGGNIIMGGGTCTTLSCDAAAISAGPISSAGITVGALGGPATSLVAGGGAIKLWGKGPTSSGGVGIKTFRSTIDSGAAGSVWLKGDGWYNVAATGNGLGIILDDQTVVRGGSGGATILANANTNVGGQWSYGLTIGNEGTDTPANTYVYTTDGGVLDITMTAPLPTLAANTNYYLYGNGGLGHATLQNGNVNLTASGGSLLDLNLLQTSIPSGNLTIVGNHGVSSNAKVISVNGTTTVTAGGVTSDVLFNTGTVTLTGALAVSGARNIFLINEGAASLGVLSGAGLIDIATKTGDLTMTQNITTTDTTSAAVTLNAGKVAAAGTSTGGNIVITGSPAVTAGAGGRVTMFTGSVSGSTGLAALVGSGSGRFRYNSDESAANYSTALSSGKYGIYRELPTATFTAASVTKTYDGMAYTGGNGVSASGLQNGDTEAFAVSGALAYSGTSQNAVQAGTYVITPSGYTSLLGYALAYADGTLAINKDTTIDDVVQSLTSFQQAVNGTQQAEGGASPAAPGADGATLYAMGPGSGSGTIQDFSLFTVLEDRTQQSFSWPVAFDHIQDLVH